uniref:Uncharacterized protein n=1 Tax=viral metagenome TaxID=1070528 RepID=A0A6C0CG73_9ZZZZ
MDSTSYEKLSKILASMKKDLGNLEKFMEEFNPVPVKHENVEGEKAIETPQTPKRPARELTVPGAPERPPKKVTKKAKKTEDSDENLTSTAPVEKVAKNTDNGTRTLGRDSKQNPTRATIIEQFGLVEGDDKKAFEKAFDKARKMVVKYINELTDEEYDNGDDIKFIIACAEKVNGKKQEVVDIVTLTIDELSKLKLTEDTEKGPGVYWDSANGRPVTGPARDVESEDLVEVKHNGTEYLVDVATSRVYDVDEKFLGFAGFYPFDDDAFETVVCKDKTNFVTDGGYVLGKVVS